MECRLLATSFTIVMNDDLAPHNTIRPRGKTVARNTYFHAGCLGSLDKDAQEIVVKAAAICGLTAEEHFNVVKLSESDAHVSLLNYPKFFDDPFPELLESWTVDLESGSANHRSYGDSLNPPILHRKELLLPADHPRRQEYQELTAAAEAIGLFDDPLRTGFKMQWEALIVERGYRLVGHSLLPIGNDENESNPVLPPPAVIVNRHLTALVRYRLSAPIQTLERHGYLDSAATIFDYGCGRGDDVRDLRANGILVAGWDPYYAPDSPITAADIVNLGFVINVIEDYEERREALKRAYHLSKKLLVVSTMLVNQNLPNGTPYNDGMVTTRGTFQKYYTQSELKQFIEVTLGREPVAVAPGIFYVFQDSDAEQSFLIRRYRSTRLPRLTIRRQTVTSRRARETEDRYAAHREFLEALWTKWQMLGRAPDETEVPDIETARTVFGSLRKALRYVASQKDLTALEQMRQRRAEDILVYLALNVFEKRQPYRQLDVTLQRDLNSFFGSYAAAKRSAKALLLSIADVEAIEQACAMAGENGLGWYAPGEFLQLHSSQVERLPPVLRVYVGCAGVLYGDYRNADLIKIHIRSGKVSLMKFDDFGQALPRMTERVKIKLRQQDVEYYGYDDGEYPPPFLYVKSRYMNEEVPGYPEQVEFDRNLESLRLYDFSGYGPKREDFLATLERNRYQVEGLKIIRSRSIPDLDAPCGRYLTYRQLIECGETQQRLKLSNVPQQADTYTALFDLASRILDPVIEYFGKIELTFGFCSAGLARNIKRGISPGLDQHAAHELKRSGEHICSRLGAAVDFLVRDEDMCEVVDWIVGNTPFDRMYFYGPDRPLHVSYGPELRGEMIEMIQSGSRLVPRIRVRAGTAPT